MRYAYKKWPARARWALAAAICGLWLYPTTALAATLAPAFAQHPIATRTTRTIRPLYQRSFDDELKDLFSGKGRKDPAVSIALAAVPPLLSIQGLGQVYNGEFGKGLLFFGFAQVSLGTYFTAVDNKTANIAFGLYMASWVWSTIDAYRSAKRINAKRGYGNVSPYHNHAHRSTP